MWDRASTNERRKPIVVRLELETEFASLQRDVATIRLTLTGEAFQRNAKRETQSWRRYPWSIWIYCSRKRRSPSGDDHAERNASSHPRMVRLHERKDPDKLRKGSREGAQYPGRPACGAFDTRSRQPYRYIQIRGRVEHVTEEGAPAHIDSLAEKYLGKDRYPWAQPGQVRITFEIEPTAVQAQG
jgi:hypothetical protein